MKIVSNRYNVALIALLLSVNNVNSHVIRDINPTLKKAGECTEENHCGADIKCIAKCYNVLNNDEESMKRTYECQHICNVKYPDPYIDTEDLTQCYEKCIYQEFYRGNNNIIDENKYRGSSVTLNVTNNVKNYFYRKMIINNSYGHILK
ncbi:hypothetical protein U3516DRAFT_825892 [Neocallimastix sp. 'constans']